MDKQELRGGRKISNGSLLQTVFSASFFSCLPLNDARIHNFESCYACFGCVMHIHRRHIKAH